MRAVELDQGLLKTSSLCESSKESTLTLLSSQNTAQIQLVEHEVHVVMHHVGTEHQLC